MKPWQNGQTDITYAQLLLFEVFGNEYNYANGKRQIKLRNQKQEMDSFFLNSRKTYGLLKGAVQNIYVLFVVVRQISREYAKYKKGPQRKWRGITYYICFVTLPATAQRLVMEKNIIERNMKAFLFSKSQLWA